MTTVLLCCPGPATVPSLPLDLQHAGFVVLDTVRNCHDLVHAVQISAPDVVICDLAQAHSTFFAASQALADRVPCAVLVFTEHGELTDMDRAVDHGVHAYVVDGYRADRLAGLVHLARARFRLAHQHQQAIDALAIRLGERKSVDRAKGLLMRAAQVSDDDAFALLRSAAMRTNQRMGQLSEHIIRAALDAQALNRAGQLRMLSQRLVKLRALQVAASHVPGGLEQVSTVALITESVERVDANVVWLAKTLALPRYGGLVASLQSHASVFLTALLGQDLNSADTHAQAVLEAAEQLTRALELHGASQPLSVLNRAGRQRMLSQRFAKCVLLQGLATQVAHPTAGDIALAQRSAQALTEARTEFEEGLTFLNSLPLSNADIEQDLQGAGVAWLKLRNANSSGQWQALAQGSEALLEVFEQLSEHYERSMQMLLG